jgi:hypothetical protein
MVYPDLRRIAGALFRGERPENILQPICVVNELFLKLLRQRSLRFEDREQFYSLASRLSAKRATVNGVTAIESESLVGRPAKANDKGKGEGLVGYARRNLMVPVPCSATWDAFNAHLEAECRRVWPKLRKVSSSRRETRSRNSRPSAASDIPAALREIPNSRAAAR